MSKIPPKPAAVVGCIHEWVHYQPPFESKTSGAAHQQPAETIPRLVLGVVGVGAPGQPKIHLESNLAKF